MKKIIKMLIVSIAVILPTASFAATLNNDSQDFSTLRVVNYTVNSACNSCWGNSATANVGDIVSFAIYYHNTGTDTATNVRVKLSPQNTTSGTAHTFVATVSADNAPTVTGTVVVTTTSSQTISFLQNGVIWRPNQTTYGSTPLPSGQLATDIFSGLGVNIGNVAPGWSTQGSVIVRFQVSNTGTGTNNSAPSVTTNSATSVYQNSATLNGQVTPNGTNTSAWFEWGTSYSLGNSTNYNNYGTGSTNFNAWLSNLNPNTTYYFRAVAQNTYGTVYGSILSFTTTGQTYNQPYVSTNSATSVNQNSAVLNGYVTSSGSNISAWFEWGTNYSLGNTTNILNYGTSATNFSNSIYNLNQNTTYYFRAVAQSQFGTVYGNIISFTTAGKTYNPNPSNPTGSAPTVTTLLATEKTGTTAKLNGLVATTEGGPSSNTWFEWGANSSLGNKTQTVNVGNLSVIKHSDFINGLTNGQTYYYRIVAENSYGTTYGTVTSFVSETSTYVPPVTTIVVKKPTTVVVNKGGTTQSLVTLAIEGGAEMIGGGEKRTYRVTWKNESTQSLKNVVLRITFPQSMKLDSATKGSFSSVENSVIVDLKTLASKENGDTFIFITTNSKIKTGELLVVTANMVFTGANGLQGDAVAYVTHRVEGTQGNNAGASIFGAGEFVPTTLFEWVILMILTLVLVLLGNHLYGRFSGEKH